MRPRLVGLCVAALLSVSASLAGEPPPASRLAQGPPAWHAAQPRHVLEDWSDTPPAGRLPAKWSFYGKKSDLRFAPAIVTNDGRRALWLKTERYSVRLARTLEVGLASTPVLSWEWKAVTLPAEGDVRSEIRDQVEQGRGQQSEHLEAGPIVPDFGKGRRLLRGLRPAGLAVDRIRGFQGISHGQSVVIAGGSPLR